VWNCDGFINRAGERLVRQASDGGDSAVSSSRKDFALAHLRDCDVFVAEEFTALHVADIANCRVFVAPVDGSVYVEGCTNCVFAVASHQLRIHSATDTRFLVRCRSNPIIEHSTGLVFGPYCCDSRDDDQSWQNVQDFNWIKPEQSPNWRSDATPVPQVMLPPIDPSAPLPPLPR
jgi:hypothetical protein